MDKYPSTLEAVDLDSENAAESNESTNGIEDRNQISVPKDPNSEAEAYDKKEILIGKDHQVSVPNWVPPEQRRTELTVERALLVWSPNPATSQQKLDDYIQASKEKYGYTAEQALGLLFWHKHNLNLATQDLANFTPFPDDWAEEDKVLFEQAFQFHGKSFGRIRQMMPHKSISSLVKYYYSWKKSRAKTSLMDNQARILKIEREKHGYYEGSATAILNPDEIIDGNVDTEGPTSGMQTSKDSLDLKLMKNNSRPPKGMYINLDDLITMATGSTTQGKNLLRSMDREIVSYKRVVQNNKQVLSSLHKKSRDRTSIEPYKIPTDTASSINAKWSNEEMLLGVQGIRTFGKDFKAISEVLGTKTESHVRSFYDNYRRRYNLDSALKEYEETYGLISKDEMEMNQNRVGEKSSSSET